MSDNNWKDWVELSRDALVGMGGWNPYREAMSFIKGKYIQKINWESPVLKGEFKINGQFFGTQLNLRSRNFPENRCNCLKGRQGYICSHAIALCLDANYWSRESLKEKSLPKKEDSTSEKPAQQESRAEEEKLTVKSLQLSDEKGKALYLGVLLPPNLASVAPRNAIMVKIECRFEGQRCAPENLFRGSAYKLEKAYYNAVALLEKWCEGKMHGLLQLKKHQLLQLLELLKGEPAIAWVNKPNELIKWVDGKLPGIHEHLIEETKTEANPQSKVVSRPSTGIRRERGVEKKLWEKDRKRLKAPAPHREIKKEEFSERRIQAPQRIVKRSEPSVMKFEIDGSEHYLSIKLPSREDIHYGQITDLLRANDFKPEPSNGRWWLRDRHKTLNFLARYKKDIVEKYGAVFTDNFEKRAGIIETADVKVLTEESHGNYSVSVIIQAGGVNEEEIRRSLVTGRRYVSNGKQTFLLDPDKLDQARDVQRQLSGNPDRPLAVNFHQKLENHALSDTEDILEPLVEHLETPATWQKRSGALKTVAAMTPAPLPKDLDEKMRTYQRIGSAWLWHLYNNDLGGILADEMGLGKTLQALGLIYSALNKREKGDTNPALVVCPAGLVENWRREAGKWFPKMKVFAHHREHRIEEEAELNQYDLIVTSYSTLIKDQDIMGEPDWTLILADEAQHIKNRRTQASKALRSLFTKGRFVLTGTPIENSLEDLRSLFAFIMPGCLAEIPKGTKGQEKAWFNERHLKQAAPYILRRAKKDVATELPDKIEQVIYCDFGKAQQKLYEQVRLKTEAAITDMEKAGQSENKIRFAALTQLLRLRQVCAEPRLLDGSISPSDSTKLAALEEILEEARDDGHRVLIFSQFTSVLKMIRERLEEKEVNTLYLDGKTKHRVELCEQFNKDESITAFLISLKAGGTGLNLTGADTVVHYDPWWNPAAEAQATDRAHRIGQTKVVTSLKLIASNTVEEKVLSLQEKKAEILRELLDESAVNTAKVSLDDIKSLLKN